jgi:hypothetical protein
VTKEDSQIKAIDKLIVVQVGIEKKNFSRF